MGQLKGGDIRTYKWEGRHKRVIYDTSSTKYEAIWFIFIKEATSEEREIFEKRPLAWWNFRKDLHDIFDFEVI